MRFPARLARLARDLGAAVPAHAAERPDHRHRSGLHPGNGRRGLLQLGVEPGAAFRRQPAGFDEGDLQPLRLEADVARRQGRERAAEQAGSDHEHQRQRDLPDDERAGDRAAPGRAAVAGVRDRLGGVEPPRPPRRDQAEADGGQHRQRHHEPHEPPVDRQRERDRIVGGADLGDEEARAPDRQQQAGHGARYGEEQALGQELPDQPAVRRAEGQARRQLVAPRRGARQQQVGDVGAGDEQDERDDPDQDEQRLAIVPAQLGQAGRRRLQPERRGEIALGQRLGRPVRKRSPPGSAAARRASAAVIASIDWPGWRRSMMLSHQVDSTVEGALRAAQAHQVDRADRCRDVERAADGGAEEPGRHDADDRERHAIDRQRPADDAGIALKAALPEPLADHQRRPVGTAAAPIVVRRQQPTESRPDAERLEEATAHHQRRRPGRSRRPSRDRGALRPRRVRRRRVRASDPAALPRSDW